MGQHQSYYQDGETAWQSRSLIHQGQTELVKNVDTASSTLHEAFASRAADSVNVPELAVFTEILETVIPQCTQGERDEGLSALVGLNLQTQAFSTPAQTLWLKEALIHTISAELPDLDLQAISAWGTNIDLFLMDYHVALQQRKQGKQKPSIPGLLGIPTSSLSASPLISSARKRASALVTDAPASKTSPEATTEINAPMLDLSMSVRDKRTATSMSMNMGSLGMSMRRDSNLSAGRLGFDGKVNYSPAAYTPAEAQADNIAYGDTVSLFAESVPGYLCVEPEEYRPVVDSRKRPAGFERYTFRFEKSSDGFSTHSLYDKEAGPGGRTEYLQYGHTLTLRHVFSNRILAINRYTLSKNDKNFYKVGLVESKGLDSNIGGHVFKIMPRYKVRKQGERVQSGDQILLAPEGDHRYIHCSDSLSEAKIDYFLEVNCGNISTSWTINLYDRCPDSMEWPLRAGECISIFHKEADSFLMSEPVDQVRTMTAQDGEDAEEEFQFATNINSDTDPNAMTFMQLAKTTSESQKNPLSGLLHKMWQLLSNDDPRELCPVYFMRPQIMGQTFNFADMEISSNSLWIIEGKDPTVGGPLKPDMLCRLKHFASGKYLTVHSPDGRDDSFRISMTVESGLAASLWYLRVLDKQSIIHSNTTALRFQHSVSGLWIHAPADHDGSWHITSTREQRAKNIHSSRVVAFQLSYRINHGDVFSLHRTFCAGLSQYQIIPSAKQKLESDVSTENGLKYVLHAVHFISKFVITVYNHTYLWGGLEMGNIVAECQKSLTNLIFFCSSGDDDPDPMTRRGLPIRRNQKLLLDQNIHAIVMEMLRCPFDPPPWDKKGKPLVSLSDITEKPYAALHHLCKLGYRLIQKIVFGSPSFALSMTDYIPFMMTQLGRKLTVDETLTAMFHDNPTLTSSVTEDMITPWIAHARAYNNQIRYASFLSAICVCKGQPRAHIQDMVAFHLFKRAPEVLLPLKLENGKVHTKLNSKESHRSFSKPVVSSDSDQNDSDDPKNISGLGASPGVTPRNWEKRNPSELGKRPVSLPSISTQPNQRRSGRRSASPKDTQDPKSPQSPLSPMSPPSGNSQMRASSGSIKEAIQKGPSLGMTVGKIQSILRWKRRALNASSGPGRYGDWVDITMFVSGHQNPAAANLMAMLNLYSALCRGNNKCKLAIQKRVSKDMLSALLGADSPHQEMTHQFWAAFCRLATWLYISNRMGLLEVAQKSVISWCAIDEVHRNVDFTQQSFADDTLVAVLKECTLEFLKKNTVQYADNPALNERIFACLTLWVELINECLVNDYERKELLMAMYHFLDTHTDKLTSRSFLDNAGFELSEENVLIARGKREACSILNALLDQQIDKAVMDCLTELKIVVSGTNSCTESKMREVVKAMDEYLASYFEQIEEESQQQFYHILLNLVKCAIPELETDALQLLFRLASFRIEAVHRLDEVLILFDPMVEHEHLKACEYVVELKHILDRIAAGTLTDTSVDTMLNPIIAIMKTLQHYEAESGDIEAGPRGNLAPSREIFDGLQDTLRKVGLHKLVMQVIKVSDYALSRQRQVLATCYCLLSLFVMGKRQNQGIVFDRMLELSGHLTMEVGYDTCLLEVIRGNWVLCSKVSEEVVDAFSARIIKNFEDNPLSVLKTIDVLQNLVVVKDIPNPRNQTIVLRSLTTVGDDLLSSLRTIPDVTKQGGLKCLSSVVELIALCTLGMNNFTESLAQSILPLPSVLEILAHDDSELDLRFKLPYLKLLHEVWFLVEDDGGDVEEDVLEWLNNNQWYAVLDQFTHTVEETIDLMEEESKTDDAHEDTIKDRISFIFQGIIPCLTSYVDAFLKPDTANQIGPSGSTWHVSIMGRLTQVFYNFLQTVPLINRLPEYAYEVLWKYFKCMEKVGIYGAGESHAFLQKAIQHCKAMNEKRFKRRHSEFNSHKNYFISKCFKNFMKNCKAKYLKGEASDPEYGYLDVDDQDELAARLKEPLMGSEETLLSVMHILKENDDVPYRTKIQLLRILTALLTELQDDERELLEAQNKMERIGACPVMTLLIEKNIPGLTQVAVDFGVALLHGGHRGLQNSLLSYFQNLDETFFSHTAAVIEKTTIALKERKREEAFLESGIYGLTQEQIQEHQQASSSSMQIMAITQYLRLLQLLCEGHHVALQNYVRDQEDNLYSHNMVVVVVQFLRELISHDMDSTLIEIAAQTFSTLTEFCQGPCEGNQRTLVAANICGVANKVLKEDYTKCDPNEVGMLHGSAVLTLLSLLEGCNDTTLPSLIIDTISLENISTRLGELWGHLKCKIQNEDELNPEDEEMVESCFNLYILMYMLSRSVESPMLSKIVMEVPGGEYYHSMLGVMEIARDDKIEKVYFRKPGICHSLTPEAKQELLSNVNRDSPASKVADFFELSMQTIYEMEFGHIQKKILERHLPPNLITACTCFLERFELCNQLLKNSSVQKLIHFGNQPWKNFRKFFADNLPSRGVIYTEDISLLLAVILNGLILYREASDGSLLQRVGLWLTFRVVALLQVFTTCLQTVLAFTYQYPLALYKYRTVASRKESINRGSETQSFQLSEAVDISFPSLWQLMELPIGLRLKFLYRPVMSAVAILGFFWSPYLFSIHLLFMIRRSAVLKSVIQSVTANGTSLILTAILGVTIIYLFSLVAFLVFPDDFVNDDGEKLCENLTQCFVFTLTFGLRAGGGVGDYLANRKWHEAGFTTRVLFDFTFFVVVIVILLNIIFGIIIDTFAELRQQKDKIEEDTRIRCFMCGIDSDTFDRHAKGGFEHHLKHSHNMWHYLHFFLHLKRKPVDEYTGQESFVFECIKKRDMSFFPLGKALDLSSDQRILEEESTKPQAELGPVNSVGVEEFNERMDNMETQLMQIENMVNQLADHTLSSLFPAPGSPGMHATQMSASHMRHLSL